MFIEENMMIRAVDKNGKSYLGTVYKTVIHPCEDDDNRPHALVFISQTENHHYEDDSDFGCIALWVDKLQRIDIIDYNTKPLEGQVVTGIKMSDGSPVEGYVIGSAPFSYILPCKEVEEACCSGEQQVKIQIVAERVLSHT